MADNLVEMLNIIPEGWNDVDELNNERQEVINKLKEAYRNKTVMEGYVSRADENYNLYIDFAERVQGIVPRKEVSLLTEENGYPHPGASVNKVGRTIKFVVEELQETPDNCLAVLSRRKAIQSIRDYLFENMKEGMVVHGIVTGLSPYFAFVDIGGDVTAVMKIQDICGAHIKEPSEKLSIGDKIDVKIKSFDPETGKVRVSRREMLGGRWDHIENDYKPGQIVMGRIKSPYNGSYFVELNDNLDILAQYAGKKKFMYGQMVKVSIKKVDAARHRIIAKILD